jgi:hypothetical protein
VTLKHYILRHVSFALIVLSAAYFRLAFINLAEFKSDEARTSSIVSALVQKGVLPLVGPPLTSGGNAGSIFYYILSLPFLISGNPVVASAFVAALNIVGVILTYRLAKDFFNVRIALITTVLVSISPFAVLFSRKIWNPDLVFPFGVILFYCLYSFVIKAKRKYLVPIFFTYAIVLQIHPITLFLAPVIILFLLRFRSQITRRYLVLGLCGALILFSPMIYGELTNRNLETRSFVSAMGYFDTAHGLSRINPISVQHIASLTSGSGFDYILGNSAQVFHNSIGRIDSYLFLANLCLYLGFALVLLISSRKPFTENVKYSILSSWIGIPMLILLFFQGGSAGLWPHHFTMFFPANFLVVAILFDFMISRTKKSRSVANTVIGRKHELVKVAGVGILLSIIIVQAGVLIGFFELLNAQGGTAGDYGVGVQYKIDVAAFVAGNSNGSSFSISQDLKPGNIGSEYYYLLGLYGKTPLTNGEISYVVINKLNSVNPSLLQQLSGHPTASFGPLTVYTVHR